VRQKVLNTALNRQVQSDKFISFKIRTNEYQNKVVKTTTKTVE